MANEESFVLVDTHCHLDDPAYGAEVGVVLARAAAAGVHRCVTIGTDVATSQRAVALAQQYPQVAAAVGIHPYEATQWTTEATTALETLAQDLAVVAIGEVGLDYYRNLTPKPQQQTTFREALGLAQRRRLPVVIHCREAWEDCFAVLRDMKVSSGRGLLHCFTGGPHELETALTLGLMISFAGNVTFKNAVPLRLVAEQVPLDALLLETDAPYLAPQSHRGQRNEPAYVVETARVIAEVKRLPVEEVARATTANAERLFGPRLRVGTP